MSNIVGQKILSNVNVRLATPATKLPIMPTTAIPKKHVKFKPCVHKDVVTKLNVDDAIEKI